MPSITTPARYGLGITIVGFVVTIVLMIFITRVATKALADAERESTLDQDQPAPV